MVDRLSANIGELLNPNDEKNDPDSATTAVFYSISNTQPGLAGINLGNFLIKSVVQKLSSRFDNLKHFATLSPVPGFQEWLGPRLAKGDETILALRERANLQERFACDNAAAHLAKVLTGEWYKNSETAETIRPVLVRLCARYLLEEKRGERALDPVANFHLNNGARLERINWLADLSGPGIERSYSIMVNYYYELGAIEKNHEEYVSNGRIVAGRGIRSLLK
jgi:malonyl-CoA decarboxylase